MPRKLKVFRTAIGFHDAYVAAPSRKAALAAWGADADLFARGVAEEVTDAKLAREPLAHPGEVIRVSRGGLADHLKALPKRKANAAAGTAEKEPAKPRRAAKPKPPPKRDKVDAAEKALAGARRTQQAAVATLERTLDALRAKQATERARLERERDAAREAYRKALDRWSAQD
ncbi:MAG TPA: hypothetical protein VL100_05575 [Croceibacterium sp.]|nr:hypothetical protein [Croceibacterium sp.]